MSLKTTITTYIQSKLSGIVGVTTHADHEDLLFNNASSVLNELYKTSSVTDTQADTNVFTTADADNRYTFQIKKQGGKVTVTGSFFCVAAGTLPVDYAWATVTTAEYEPSENTYFSGYTTYGGENVRMTLFDNGGTWELRTLDPVGSFETITFNITYFVGA